MPFHDECPCERNGLTVDPECHRLGHCKTAAEPTWWYQGFEAFLDGLDIRSCPATTPEDRMEFVAGYLEAARAKAQPTKMMGE